MFAKRPVLTSEEGASNSSSSGDGSSRPSFMYYVNDGIYGSFNCIMFDHHTVVPALLQVRDSLDYYKIWDNTIIEPRMWLGCTVLCFYVVDTTLMNR